MRSPTYPCVPPLTHAFSHLPMRSLTYPCDPPLTPAFPHLPTRSFASFVRLKLLWLRFLSDLNMERTKLAGHIVRKVYNCRERKTADLQTFFYIFCQIFIS